MVIDSYDSRTFRPVAVMIVGKADLGCWRLTLGKRVIYHGDR